MAMDADPHHHNNNTSISFLTKGSQVEVSSHEDGFNGAWYSATVIHPPPSNSSPNQPTSNSLVYVEYHNLLSEDGSSNQLREYANISSVRPSPVPDTNPPNFQLNDFVDAFYRDGWWTGVITTVVDNSNFVVTFPNPPDEIQFRSSDLRIHRKWIGDRWIQPQKQIEQATPIVSKQSPVATTLIMEGKTQNNIDSNDKTSPSDEIVNADSSTKKKQPSDGQSEDIDSQVTDQEKREKNTEMKASTKGSKRKKGRLSKELKSLQDSTKGSEVDLFRTRSQMMLKRHKTTSPNDEVMNVDSSKEKTHPSVGQSEGFDLEVSGMTDQASSKTENLSHENKVIEQATPIISEQSPVATLIMEGKTQDNIDSTDKTSPSDEVMNADSNTKKKRPSDGQSVDLDSQVTDQEKREKNTEMKALTKGSKRKKRRLSKDLKSLQDSTKGSKVDLFRTRKQEVVAKKDATKSFPLVVLGLQCNVITISKGKMVQKPPDEKTSNAGQDLHVEWARKAKKNSTRKGKRGKRRTISVNTESRAEDIAEGLAYDTKHNICAYLDTTFKYYYEFKGIIQFLRRSRIHYAISVHHDAYVNHMREFWNNAVFDSSGNPHCIRSTVLGQPIVISQQTVREVLQFNDNDTQHVIFPITLIRGLFARICYSGNLENTQYLKANMSRQYKYLMHVLIHCLGPRKGGYDAMRDTLQSAMVALVLNKPFNFSGMLFLHMKKNLKAKIKKFIMYPRFVQMMIDHQAPNMPKMDCYKINFEHMNETTMTRMRTYRGGLPPMKRLIGHLANPDYVEPPNDRSKHENNDSKNEDVGNQGGNDDDNDSGGNDDRNKEQTETSGQVTVGESTEMIRPDQPTATTETQAVSFGDEQSDDSSTESDEKEYLLVSHGSCVMPTKNSNFPSSGGSGSNSGNHEKKKDSECVPSPPKKKQKKNILITREIQRKSRVKKPIFLRESTVQSTSAPTSVTTVQPPTSISQPTMPAPTTITTSSQALVAMTTVGSSQSMMGFEENFPSSGGFESNSRNHEKKKDSVYVPSLSKKKQKNILITREIPRKSRVKKPIFLRESTVQSTTASTSVTTVQPPTSISHPTMPAPTTITTSSQVLVAMTTVGSSQSMMGFEDFASISTPSTVVTTERLSPLIDVPTPPGPTPNLIVLSDVGPSNISQLSMQDQLSHLTRLVLQQAAELQNQNQMIVRLQSRDEEREAEYKRMIEFVRSLSEKIDVQGGVRRN